MLNVVQPAADSTVLVVGAGAVGLAAIMAVKLSPSKPSKVIAVDIVPERLELAKKYGATHVVNSKESPDLKAALMALTDGKGVDGAIDTTGRPAVLQALLDSAAKKGVVVSVGVGQVSISISVIVRNQSFQMWLTVVLSSLRRSPPTFSTRSILAEGMWDAVWAIVGPKSSSLCC
jgi:aryl-alcohol dehydrogenase